LVAGAVVIVLVATIWIRAGGGIDLVRPDMANVGNQAATGTATNRPPDISQMSPRERFDRLYARVMSAGAGQDSTAVVQFTPMALGAYELLEEPDHQARFRAAMIRLQVGDYRGAAALADTMLAAAPNHLLGLMVQGTGASFQQDDVGLDVAYSAFLEHYDAEIAAGRDEYRAEERMISSFRQAALRGQTD